MNNPCQDSPCVIPGEAVNNQIKDKPKKESIDNEESVPANELDSGPGYGRSTSKDVRCMIWEALKEHGEDRLSCVIHDRYEQVVLTIFLKAQEQALNSNHTSINKVTERAAIKRNFTGGAEQ